MFVPFESLSVRRLTISLRRNSLLIRRRVEAVAAAAGALRLVGGRRGEGQPASGPSAGLKRNKTMALRRRRRLKLKRLLTDLKRSLGHKARKRVRPSVRLLKKKKGRSREEEYSRVADGPSCVTDDPYTLHTELGNFVLVTR